MYSSLVVCWALFWRFIITLYVLVNVTIIISFQAGITSLDTKVTVFGSYVHSAVGVLLIYLTLVFSLKWSFYSSKSFRHHMVSLVKRIM